jgi:AcrR family transcriptional regulator
VAGLDPARSFEAFLRARLEGDATLPKRERTRERLRIAAVQVLDERGYNGMRAIDVTEAAGLAEGSFYVYFRSKVDITLDILESFFLEFLQMEHATRAGEGRFASIQAVNRRWLDVAAANPGLMRCALQTAHEVPEISALTTQLDLQWQQRIISGVKRRGGGTVTPLMVYLLSGMVDEITRRLIVYPEEPLLALLKQLGADHLDVADAASAIWHDILYPGLPLDCELSPAARALAGRI